MNAWSQSPFLQALGWAMLNSLWQMALLYSAFSLLLHTNRLSSFHKYRMALGSLGAGIFWFGFTFFTFYSRDGYDSFFDSPPFAINFPFWNLFLSSISLIYILLLLIPAFRFAANWRHIGHLKKFGLDKAALEYRLFVKKIAQQLGIKHTVRVYISQFVQSPVTIGYLKPIILIPIGALTNLTPHQTEAVLLHELAHIKRYDYLINFIIMLLQTLFYFNPFVKKFVSIIEFHRENCCDELVVQFEYDKISYASALLALEKNQIKAETLAVGAAGKNHLLSRIEKIVGVEKQPAFSLSPLLGLLSSVMIMLFINTLFTVGKPVQKAANKDYVFTAFDNSAYQYVVPAPSKTFSKPHASSKNSIAKKPLPPVRDQNVVINPREEFESIDNQIIPVTYDASNELVTIEEKQQIEQALESTKEVLAKTKWNEVETAIADGMTLPEKNAARQEYLAALNDVNWKKLETHLKSEYNNLNWEEIQARLNKALTGVKLDSLQTIYRQILSELRKNHSDLNPAASTTPPVLPDASLKEVNKLKSQLNRTLDSIQLSRQRKVIDF